METNYENIFSFYYDDTNKIIGLLIENKDLLEQWKEILTEDEDTGKQNLLSFDNFDIGTEIEKKIESAIDTYNDLDFYGVDGLLYKEKLVSVILDYLYNRTNKNSSKYLDQITFDMAQSILATVVIK